METTCPLIQYGPIEAKADNVVRQKRISSGRMINSFFMVVSTTSFCDNYVLYSCCLFGLLSGKHLSSGCALTFTSANYVLNRLENSLTVFNLFCQIAVLTYLSLNANWEGPRRMFSMLVSRFYSWVSSRYRKENGLYTNSLLLTLVKKLCTSLRLGCQSSLSLVINLE